MEIAALCFDRPGPHNTGPVLAAVDGWTRSLGVDTVLVATTSGATGVLAAERLAGRLVVAVTHAAGFTEPGVEELLPGNRDRILAAGGRVLTCQHALAGIGRAVRMKFGTYELDEIVANAFRVFGQGVKVALEIALMAADAGMVGTGRDVISVGGTGSGADTAVWLRPANVSRFFDLRVRAILCKPSEF
jgi:uncharacterized protein